MPAEYSITHHVHFAETDMAGIVHFSNYFRWMEEVEHAYLRSLGLSVSMLHDGLHLGWPRVSVSCEYFGPVRFEDDVRLTLRVTKVGGKSFSYEVDFALAGKRVALGKSTSVCCSMEGPAGMRAIAIPQSIREKLESGA